jgi:capsular polysaccharide biosynthesis protein
MWAWDEAVRLEPDVRVLVAVNRARTTLPRWELQLHEAAGIDPDRITVIDQPVRVERLLGPTPLYSMPYYVHPQITATWDRIGAYLRNQAPDRDYPRRIFCSRKIEKRACHNAREVDALFSRHGFEVVFPEEFPLAEQAAMFHEAEIIAGFAGSALFNVMFTDRPKHLIAVASETYTPRNEYLISALRGNRLDMSHSRPDTSDPQYHNKRFMSSFTFDFEREGRWLEDEVLAHLDA